MKTVLCFGDSNTHGTPGDDPAHVRLSPGIRWPGRLRTRLGPEWMVVEEGLNGRTVASDYADRPGLNGHTYLVPCLLSHHPLDVIVLMLGTNDVKVEFSLSVEKLISQWEAFLDDVTAYAPTAEVVLVSPIRIDPAQPRFATDAVAFDAGSVTKADRLAAAYADLAYRRGLVFLDAAGVAAAGADGIHLTETGHAALATALADLIIQR